ncbi:MAG: response regulator [Chloroflexi bacterium]|nr:response regulator [Chloroflexota bacterium]
MDQTDRDIIELLRQDGRRSNVEIARELGVSEGTVRKRIERLIESDALRIVGLVDPAKVGFQIRAIIFLKIDLAQVDQANRLLCEMPEVLNLYWVTGEYDFIVDAVFESNKHLVSFLTERLGNVPGVISSRTAHVLHIQKSAQDWALPSFTKRRVLVVDDDPDFVEVTRLVLEREGFEVRTARNGAEALRAMTTAPADLVIMDVMMDGVLDGWDASWRIRSHPLLRETPILVVSSITASDYLGLFPTDEDNLIDNFLSKPVAPDQLVREVKRLLDRF